MTTTHGSGTRTVALTAAAFLVGLGLAGAAFVNPFGWTWLEDVTGPVDSRRAALVDIAAGPPSPAREVLFYRSPMDPTVTSPVATKDSMGMDFLPVYAGDEARAPAPGTVRIDPTFVQNIGVQSEPVRRTDIPFTIRTVGSLVYDDRQVTWVNTKYEGWIENVSVNYVGEPVERGQVLFEIFSPQLVQTQQEYVQAVDYVRRLGESEAYPEILVRARALVRSARQRLAYWDIGEDQLDALADTGVAKRTLPVVSPVSGLVVDTMDQALDGMYARPGMNLYKIVDLSTIWVEAAVFEHQVSQLRVGQPAIVELPYQPGRRYRAQVRFIAPAFDRQTRTMTVSLELANPSGELRADMYADVTFEVPSARQVLAVPQEAVLRTGTRDAVVLDRGHGTFEVREVALGVNGNGLWEIRDGVSEGDRVVVSSQFLIDSESSLREAVRKLTAPSMPMPPAPEP